MKFLIFNLIFFMPFFIIFILIKKTDLEKRKKTYFRILKLIVILWIISIITFTKLKKNLNGMGYLDIIIISGKVIFVYIIFELIMMLKNADFQKRMKIFKGVAIIFFVWSIIFSIDYIRVQNDKLPIFCFKLGGLQDGGTIYYIGIGYKVIDFHALDKLHEPKIEEKVICSWNLSYEEALKKVKENLIED